MISNKPLISGLFVLLTSGLLAQPHSNHQLASKKEVRNKIVLKTTESTPDNNDESEFEFTVQIQDKVCTSESEFGGYPVNGSIIFCSSTLVGAPVGRKDENTKSPLYSLYKAKNTEGTLSDSKLIEGVAKKHFGPVCATPSGDQLYITCSRIVRKRNKKRLVLSIYRTDATEKYDVDKFEPFKYNDEQYSVGHPCISRDGKTIYFASDKPGGFGGTDIYKAEINEDGTIGHAENLGGRINTQFNEYFPWAGSNGILFFSSDGHDTRGGQDIFSCSPIDQDNWEKAKNLGPSINTVDDEFAFVMMDDDQHGFFSSNRENGVGHDDIYRFTVNKPIVGAIIARGTVTNKINGEPLAGIPVKLLTTDGAIVQEMKSSENGTFSFELGKKQGYSVECGGKNFQKQSIVVAEEQTDKLISSNTRFSLEKSVFGSNLIISVIDNETNKPLKGVKARILNSNGQESVIHSNEYGILSKKMDGKNIGDSIALNLKISKVGYSTIEEKFEGKITSLDGIRLNKQLSAAVLSKGDEIGKLFDLEPIYFELNSARLTPAAKKELDNIVKLLNDKPNLSIELGSHTDTRGKSLHNMKLSNRRAKATALYIQNKVSTPKRVTHKGYGETAPLNKCKNGVECDEKDHAVNRRTEFRIIKL